MQTISTTAPPTWEPASPRREPTYAQRGLVASAHQFASAAGLDVLSRGGNAVDAAIAAAAVMMAARPWLGHLGGDAFMLLHHAPSGATIALNGSGAAPAAATLERYQALGEIPESGLLAASVPGVVHLWGVALERFGSRPLGELLQPAIEYAEIGVQIASQFQRALASTDLAVAGFVASGGNALEISDILRQPGLANTLRRIGEYGPDEFYAGELTDLMVHYAQTHNGLFTHDDFAAHQTEVVAPLSITYRGYTVYEQPAPSQGIIVLLALKILEQFDLAALGHASAATTHLLVEALKLGFEDVVHHLGDPRFVDPPYAHLLSDEHARAQAARIDLHAARPTVFPAEVHKDTTYLCTADADGTMVSYIQSLFAGCGVVLGDTGVWMNNRMRGFNLQPGHPNCLSPGKRPMHTLNEYLVRRDGETVLVGGTPGGHWQVQTNLQALTAILDFGLDVQQAIEAPQFAMGVQLQPGDPTLNIDPRFGAATLAALRDLGHPLNVTEPWGVGGNVHLIARDPATGRYTGASEVRWGGGSALGR
ncbi:MAG: gamma-glutamyltransferase [Chloroflexi bacterium]|nr:MAG: gamma-glutamyltransferase [Chloroflexota bacterium]